MNETCLCEELDMNIANPFLLCVTGTCPVKDTLCTRLATHLHSPWLTFNQTSKTSRSRPANTPNLPI